jgi:osmotically-inducible protein OsmY
MTDGWITTRVKSRFVGQRLLKGSDIDVDTDKHVVTLTGTVANAAGKSRAAVIAKGTEGVSRVVNRLTIGPRT